MQNVAWSGPVPARLMAALESRGIRPSRPAANATVRVISTTSSQRTPQAPAEPHWIWFASGRVPDTRRREAILRGAYDVIDARAAGAAGELGARLEELLTPEPPAPVAE